MKSIIRAPALRRLAHWHVADPRALPPAFCLLVRCRCTAYIGRVCPLCTCPALLFQNMITQGYGESDLKVQTSEAEAANRRAVVRNITGLLR